jgi:ABC-type branched-subunit amino acid transport system ATPase component
MPLLEALGLQKRFGGIHAVNDVSFNVEMGEIIGLIGPNGSGKSTILGLLMGVHKPNSGTIRFAGEDIQNWPINKRIKNGIAIVFQHSRPLNRQTVLDNIKLSILPDRLFSFYYPADLEAKAREIATLVGLQDVVNTYPSSLPFGHIRRMEFAKALALNPRLLLLDEPFAGLTPSEISELASLILSIRKKNQAIVLVDHNVKAVFNFVDKIIALYVGNKIAEGKPDEVISDKEVRRVFIGKSMDASDPCTPGENSCPSSKMPLLDLNIGSVHYGQAEILRKVQIGINEGEFVSLVGLNGAGKSSLLKAILGLVDYEGEVKWQGRSTKNLTTAQIVRLGIAFAPETRELFRYLTVKENLELGGDRLKPTALKERLAYVYELFPILKERLEQPAYTLSGGEQQMLTIARAMMQKPSLLILDEPTLGLAPVVLDTISTTLANLHEKMGLTILLGEQNLHFALKHSQRIYLLEHGSVTWKGNVGAFLKEVGEKSLV